MSVWSRNGAVALALLSWSLPVPTLQGAEIEPVKPVTSADPQSQARDCARLVWAMLDLLERQHIAAPNRDAMLACVYRVLLNRQPQDGDALLEKMRTAQSPDEFTDVFQTRILAAANGVPEVRQTIVESLSKQLGSEIHLLNAKDYAVEEQLQNNRYVGLGVTLTKNDSGYAQFPTILPGGAAERGGLVDGVTILAVDGRSTKGIGITEVLDWLRGPKGSQVTLKLAPQGKMPERDVTLTRSTVRIDSVFGVNRTPLSRNQFRTDLNDPAYLHVTSISGSTLQELRDAEVRLKSMGVKSLILDFRNANHAADIHNAQLLTDALLDGGPIWTWQERDLPLRVEVADRECLFRNMPLVIAIDRSAGPAHVAVAAALQDAGRAIIVGDPPDYDGQVPMTFPLSDGRVPNSHVLRFASARLIRSRTDRSWPLRADRAVNSVLGHVRIDRHGTDLKTGAVSALVPSNRTGVAWYADQWKEINKIRSTHEHDILAMAKKVAAELQTKNATAGS